MNNAPVDIVISTYNRGDAIDGAIADIRRNTHSLFTLWVLDQSEDNATEECVRRHAAEDPRIIYERVPLRNIAATRNLGATKGTADYILFTNDDCRPEPDWIAQLLAELADPETWMVFGRVLPGRRPASAGGSVNETVAAIKPTEQRKVYQKQRFNLGFGRGHNMGVRRDRFVQVGGFDEFLGGGALGAWDERDIGYRVLRLGGKIVYSPRAVVYHCHWQTWSSVQRSYQFYGLGAGASAAKYIRCGDKDAALLLIQWMFDQGVRQVLSGIFKWRKWGKIAIGLSQLYYPLVGVARSFRYTCDPTHVVYGGEQRQAGL